MTIKQSVYTRPSLKKIDFFFLIQWDAIKALAPNQQVRLKQRVSKTNICDKEIKNFILAFIKKKNDKGGGGRGERHTGTMLMWNMRHEVSSPDIQKRISKSHNAIKVDIL